MLTQVLQSIDATRTESLDRLKSFLRIPSVSTKPDHKPDMQRCAEFLATEFRACGLTPTIPPTKAHPTPIARNDHPPPRPPVLLYGHYDVQPPEPLADWTTPPFDPPVRNDE